MSECVVRMNIKEMPAACGPCELSCTYICMEWTKIDRKEIGRTKSPDCPIVAILPEGHGRLVDVDALIERLKKEKVDMQKHIPKGFAEEIAGMCGEIDGVICSIVTANRMPTIVPAALKEESQDEGN